MGNDDLTNDELIRVLASMRTDLNAKRLIIKAVPGQIPHDLLLEKSYEIEDLQERMEDYLTATVRHINKLIEVLGGKP